jgi:hypothetical protein
MNLSGVSGESVFESSGLGEAGVLYKVMVDRAEDGEFQTVPTGDITYTG